MNACIVLKDGTRQWEPAGVIFYASWQQLKQKRVEKWYFYLLLYMLLFYNPQQACKAESKDYYETLILVCLNWKLLKTQPLAETNQQLLSTVVPSGSECQQQQKQEDRGQEEGLILTDACAILSILNLNQNFQCQEYHFFYWYLRFGIYML